MWGWLLRLCLCQSGISNNLNDQYYCFFKLEDAEMVLVRGSKDNVKPTQND